VARILFALPPLIGHLNPMLAVAAQLSAAGHELAWAIHTRQLGASLPDAARVFSLDAGDQVTTVVLPKVRGLESVRLFFEDYALPMAEQSLPLIEQAALSFKPDVMVVDHQMIAGALVARKLGIAWLTSITTSASILRMSPMLDDWVAGQYAGLQQRYMPSEAESARVARPDFSPWLNLVFSIEELLGTEHARVEAPYAFLGPAIGQGRREIDFPWQWLRDDCRHILVTLGTISRDRDTRFFEVIMAAIADMPNVQAVLVGPESLSVKAPANVLVRDFVPQVELLKKMHGVICHAGHNTVCETLMHNLPMIVAPIRDDQPVIARQAIDAGAALFMRHGKVSVATAKTTIHALLNTPELNHQAARLGAVLRKSSGAVGAAEHIVRIANVARA
jgi:MGT family glycosyltransferase